jgi:hypothetical protein
MRASAHANLRTGRSAKKQRSNFHQTPPPETPYMCKTRYFFVNETNVVFGQPIFKLLIGCDETIVQAAGDVEEAQLVVH